MTVGDVMVFRKDRVTILQAAPNLTRVSDGDHEYWVKTQDLKPVPAPKIREQI